MDDLSHPEINGVDLTISRRGVIVGAAALAAAAVESIPKPARAVPLRANIRNATAWANGTFSLGQRCTNAGKAYQCTNAGTSTSAPTGTGTSINNGGVAVFAYSSRVDFVDINSWVAHYSAINGGTLTQPIVAYLWNDRPGTALNPGSINGIRTSVTADMTIKCAPGESFSDNLNRASHKLRPSANYGVLIGQTADSSPALYAHVKYLTLEGLQIRNFGASGAGADVRSRKLTADRCIFGSNGFHEAASLSLDAFYHGTASQGIGLALTNVVMSSYSTTLDSGRCIISNQLIGAESIIENCTFILPSNYTYGPFPPAPEGNFALGGGVLDRSMGRNLTVHNCGFFGFFTPIGFIGNNGLCDHIVTVVPDGHCATDGTNFGCDASNMTVGTLTGVPRSTATFKQSSATGNGLDLRLASGSRLLRAGGTPITTAARYDIFGTRRRNGGVDIGAFQATTSVL